LFHDWHPGLLEFADRASIVPGNVDWTSVLNDGKTGTTDVYIPSIHSQGARITQEPRNQSSSVHSIHHVSRYINQKNASRSIDLFLRVLPTLRAYSPAAMTNPRFVNDLVRTDSVASDATTMASPTPTIFKPPALERAINGPVPPEHPFRTLVLCFDGTGDQLVHYSPLRSFDADGVPTGSMQTCVLD
jgi:hypothetical protein